MKNHLKKTHNTGFSLIEVMIALVLSSMALLGLAAAQSKSLQYATNSFQYTVALVQANNAVEKFWLDLCDLQQGIIVYDNDYKATFIPVAGYTLTLPNNFTNDFEINVSWVDERITDGLVNSVDLNVSFPQLPGGC